MTTTNAKIVLTAEDRASRVIGQVQKQMATAGSTATEFAGAVGLINPAFAAIAGAAGLTAFVKGALDARDALNDVADATGASIEGLSGLERVAKLNGGTLDDVAGILVKFNAALNEAGNPDSDAARVFASLGLSIKDLKAQDPATALQQAAVALAGFADNGDKARVVQELFGKSIKQAAPLLKDLADAGELNGKTTEDQAKQAEALNKELFKLKVSAEEAAQNLLNQLVPAINQMFQAFSGRDWGGQGSLSDMIAVPLQAVSVLGANVAFVLKGIGTEIGGLAAQAVLFASLDFKGAAAIGDIMKKDAKAAREEFDKLEQRLLSIGKTSSREAGAGRGFINPPSILPTLPPSSKGGKGGDKAKADKPPAAYSYADEVAQSVGRAIGDADVLKAQKMADEVALLDKLFFDLGLSADLYESAMRKVTGATKAAAGDTGTFREEQKRLADLLGNTTTAKLERQRDDMALLAKYFEAGAISAQQFGEAATAALGLVADEADKTTDTMKTMLDQFARNAQDTLGDTLEATLRGNFDSIGQLWGNMIIKMIAQAGAAQLGQTLLGDFAKSGNIGGIFGSVLGAIGFGAPKANGGSVSAMSLQRVNERGFEVFTTGGQDWLMTGGRGGTVTPNSQVNLGAPAPAPVVNVHNNISAGVTRGEVNAAVQWGMQKALQTMRAELRGQRVLA